MKNYLKLNFDLLVKFNYLLLIIFSIIYIKFNHVNLIVHLHKIYIYQMFEVIKKN